MQAVGPDPQQAVAYVTRTLALRYEWAGGRQAIDAGELASVFRDGAESIGPGCPSVCGLPLLR